MDFTDAIIQNSSFTECLIRENLTFPSSIKNCIFERCTMPAAFGTFLTTQETVQVIDPQYVD